MINQNTVVNYSNGEDLVAAILNRPIDTLDSNQQAIAQVLNQFFDFDTGNGIIKVKHNNAEVLRSIVDGIQIVGAGGNTTSMYMDNETLKVVNNTGDGSIEFYADADGPSGAELVLKVLGSFSGGVDSGVVLYADGSIVAATEKDRLNMYGHIIRDVGTPVFSGDAANKAYVDTVVGGSFVSGHFTYNGTTMVPYNTVGIQSIDKIGNGVYRINFSTPFPDENYKLVAFCTQDNSGNRIVSIGENPNEARTASYCSVRSAINGLGTVNPANLDVIITY